MNDRPLHYQPNPTRQSPQVLFVQAAIRSWPIGFSAGAHGTIDHDGNYFADYAGKHSKFEGHHEVPTSARSLFDVASVTKSVVALLAFYCISHGDLRLDHKVRDLIPGLRSKTSVDPTILDLLTYRVRFHLDHLTKPYTAHGPDELARLIATAQVTVGDTLSYGNYQAIMLADILRRVSTWDIRRLAREVLFDPLGMSATFDPPQSIDDVVATEIDQATGLPLCGVPHDELTRASGLLGASGLFCTCGDLLRIGEFILNKGSHQGSQIIHERFVHMMGVNQFATGPRFGVGFGIWDEFASGFDPMTEAVQEIGADYSEGAIFKNGFGSATLAVFPAIDRAVAVMTNCAHPRRPPDSRWINTFRYAAIMHALTGQLPSDAKDLWSVK